MADLFYNFRNLSFAPLHLALSRADASHLEFQSDFRKIFGKEDYFNSFSIPSLPNKVAGKMLDFCKTDYVKIGN